MSFWEKAKDAAKKAAESAQAAKEKATEIARDQYHREGSAFNRAVQVTSELKDRTLDAIDSLDAPAERGDAREAAERLQKHSRNEAKFGTPDYVDPDEAVADDGEVRFPNSLGLSDSEVYSRVAETMYPEFGNLRGDKRWALCEIARFDKRMVGLNREVGSAYIETYRQLAASDPSYRTVLEAAGTWQDQEIQRAYQHWLEDMYDDEFYADDDPGRSKGERLLGSLVWTRCGDAISRAFRDAGLDDPFGLTAAISSVQQVHAAREEVALKHFRPRRSKLESDFLVHRGLNADISFAWLEPGGEEPQDDPMDLGGLTEM